MLYIVWSLIFLTICAGMDLKEQKVYTTFCLCNALTALLMHLVRQDIGWSNVLLGMILGAILFVAGIFTNESIGKGDGVVGFSLGCLLGVKVSFQILGWASVLCMVVSLVGIVTKKLNLKSKIPFIPFMFIGAVITFAIQGG